MNKRMNDKAGVRTPLDKLGARDTIEHYNAVLLEDIRTQVLHGIEVSEETRTSLQKQIDDFRCETDRRFTTLEVAVTHHSSEIKELKSEMKAVEKRMTSRMDEMEERLTNKMDKIAFRVDDHETRIIKLESSAA